MTHHVHVLVITARKIYTACSVRCTIMLKCGVTNKIGLIGVITIIRQ